STSTMMSDLPEDLLEEILCRLRSTCKQWNRLFNDKRFTRKHIDKAAKQSMILIMLEKKLRICSLSVNHKVSPSIESKPRFEIYEINSDSWRILVTPNCRLLYTSPRNDQYDFYLVSFEFTTERFGRMRLPYQHSYQTLSLSVVREEKLSVLLQRTNTQWREIWVTNKIGEWNKVLTILDSPPFYGWIPISFWVDEEKEVVVCCKRMVVVYNAGEDNKVTQVDFVEAAMLGCLFV
ncbi:hypothetical protein EUTSA_v10027516mg, partial [Eutrema salsugineum]